jgi:hypothetical protein
MKPTGRKMLKIPFESDNCNRICSWEVTVWITGEWRRLRFLEKYFSSVLIVSTTVSFHVYPPGLCVPNVTAGLCDGLITRPEKSYRLWCVLVCDLATSRMRRLKLIKGCKWRIEKKKLQQGQCFCNSPFPFKLHAYRRECSLIYVDRIQNGVLWKKKKSDFGSG